MAFDSIPQIVQVRPTSEFGSTLATLKLWVDEAVLNSSASLTIRKYFIHRIYQNNSNQLVQKQPRYRPVFKIAPSDDHSISSAFYIKLDNVTLLRLSASSKERCIASSAKRYVAIAIDLRLLSGSLYHLGDHSITIQALLRTSNISVAYFFSIVLRLRVEAGLIYMHVSHTFFLMPICTPGFIQKCI